MAFPKPYATLRSLSIDSGLSCRMSRTSRRGRMKIMRCSSSPDKNAVFNVSWHQLPRVRSHALHGQGLGLCRECGVVSKNLGPVWACHGFAGGLPRPHPSSSHHSIFVSNAIVHNSKTLLSSRDCNFLSPFRAKQFSVLIRHLPLVHFNTFVVSTSH